MAELEILKHAKKSYTILKSTGKDWGHKLKEIIIEILIIVFAVSISIWFHNWSEKRHEDKEEKEFFIGFRKDLGNDIENMTLKEFHKIIDSDNYKIKYIRKIKINKLSKL